MNGRIGYRAFAALAVSVIAAAGLTMLPQPATANRTPPPAFDRSMPLPKTPKQPGHLAPIGGPSGVGALGRSQAAAVAAAISRARASGKPVAVTAMTTPTTTVTAMTRGGLSLTERLYPVRVRRGHGWAPVSTGLRRGPNRSLRPVAVPGDAVSFSGGGTGPLATISAAGTSLSLWWPRRLPVPQVSGATATFHDILPGVDLMLTATSVQAGGFSDVLVVHNAAAAANPALARLRLRVTTRGVRLGAAADGRLVASGLGIRGYYAAPAPQMWDSSSLDATASHTAVRSALAEARAVGAHLAPPGPPSSPGGPGGGAHLAPVATRVSAGGKTLSLVPDRALLTSKTTAWPVYIDPTFEWWPAPDGNTQAYIPLQSDCPTATNYNNSSYQATPVGYDNFGGECASNSTDYSDFRLTVPSKIYGAHLHSATVNAAEVYSSDCSSSANVTLSWSGNFGPSTDWNNQPKVIANQDTKSVGPDNPSGTPGSCDGHFNFSITTPVSFNVMNAMTLAAAQHWAAFAFRLWEPGNTNENVHKQFGDHSSTAPFLQITYNYTPDVPTSEKATANTDGSGSAGCDTTGTNPPTIGAISGSGPSLWAHFADQDGDLVDGTFRYWKYPASSPVYNTLPPVTNLSKTGGPVTKAIPASFYNALANGQVIAWDAQATDGTYTSAWSPTCYFTAFPTAPAAPSISAPVAGSNCLNGVIHAGCQVTFTITAASNDPATEFVWSLDELPATTSPPASEMLAASGSPPSATLTITVPSPGPHNLWVYASDKGANDSGTTNGAPAGGGDTTFTAAADPAANCASFADALGNTCSLPSSPNTIISRLTASPAIDCGATTGDGDGANFDAASLEQAGWQPGAPVTIDGATFTVPSFGNCGADNVLAAGQTIGMPAGAQGTALEFLATSSFAIAKSTGLTGALDSGTLALDPTVPGVPGGTAVTGGGCSFAGQQDVNVAGCEPASGTVNYTSSCSVPSTSYDLTVPDWVTGPGDIAALNIAKRDLPSGSISDQPKLYAFSVPIQPGCQIASVTLPDVSNTVSIQLDGGSAPASYTPSALHIFGMAVRNITTATPEAGGSTAAAPAGQSWTGAWAAPIEDAAGPPSGSWGNQTLRIAAKVAATGPQVRIRLSNPGFISTDGDAPLQIGHATIAMESAQGSAVPVASTITPLTFGNSGSVTIPAGGDIYSDPLSFPVTSGQSVLVSLYLSNPPGSLPYLPLHGWNDVTGMQWTTAPAAAGTSGDHTTDPSDTAFNSAGGGWWSINTEVMTGVDVTTAQTTTDPAGIPTVSVLGDNLIDVNYSTLNSQAVSFPITRMSGGLAASQAGTFSVVAGGVNSNQASADSALSRGLGGVSAVARLDRDVLAEPGIGTVIIDEGLQDALHGASEQQLDDAYRALITELSGFGVNVILASITPCGNYSSSAAGDSCSAAVEGVRTSVNTDMTDLVAFPNCAADLNAAVTAGGSPETLLTADDAGDHVNLTQAGYTALTNSVLRQCGLAASLNPIP